MLLEPRHPQFRRRVGERQREVVPAREHHDAQIVLERGLEWVLVHPEAALQRLQERRPVARSAPGSVDLHERLDVAQHVRLARMQSGPLLPRHSVAHGLLLAHRAARRDVVRVAPPVVDEVVPERLPHPFVVQDVLLAQGLEPLRGRLHADPPLVSEPGLHVVEDPPRLACVDARHHRASLHFDDALRLQVAPQVVHGDALFRRLFDHLVEEVERVDAVLSSPALLHEHRELHLRQLVEEVLPDHLVVVLRDKSPLPVSLRLGDLRLDLPARHHDRGGLRAAHVETDVQLPVPDPPMHRLVQIALQPVHVPLGLDRPLRLDLPHHALVLALAPADRAQVVERPDHRVVVRDRVPDGRVHVRSALFERARRREEHAEHLRVQLLVVLREVLLEPARSRRSVAALIALALESPPPLDRLERVALEVDGLRVESRDRPVPLDPRQLGLLELLDDQLPERLHAPRRARRTDVRHHAHEMPDLVRENRPLRASAARLRAVHAPLREALQTAFKTHFADVPLCLDRLRRVRERPCRVLVPEAAEPAGRLQVVLLRDAVALVDETEHLPVELDLPVPAHDAPQPRFPALGHHHARHPRRALDVLVELHQLARGERHALVPRRGRRVRVPPARRLELRACRQSRVAAFGVLRRALSVLPLLGPRARAGYPAPPSDQNRLGPPPSRQPFLALGAAQSHVRILRVERPGVVRGSLDGFSALCYTLPRRDFQIGYVAESDLSCCGCFTSADR